MIEKLRGMRTWILALLAFVMWFVLVLVTDYTPNEIATAISIVAGVYYAQNTTKSVAHTVKSKGEVK